ncbi:hypothetical protein ASE52_14875 [Acidovorax sp. Root275]|uniref:hypothetical protein n=1 Tax=Acidovorax sp. Root275 TaxID=1736508 RepID=UPI00070C129C|nr:hypothetical protein [Acidovorax sp. Root275]KRD48612.1 hypothetical protein ASE52_14875 [Acidovorax sp. Root275]
MSRQQIPAALAAPLRVILEAELARGNTIDEVADWPPQCELLVILRRPFAAAYPTRPGVEFTAIEDRHYWKSEYNLDGGRQTLACGFG